MSKTEADFVKEKRQEIMQEAGHIEPEDRRFGVWPDRLMRSDELKGSFITNCRPGKEHVLFSHMPAAMAEIVYKEGGLNWLDLGTGNGIAVLNYARWLKTEPDMGEIDFNLQLTDLRVGPDLENTVGEVHKMGLPLNMRVDKPKQCSAVATGFRTREFNVVTAINLFHWLPEGVQEIAVDEIARITTENAVVLIDTGTPFNAASIGYRNLGEKQRAEVERWTRNVRRVEHPRYGPMHFPDPARVASLLKEKLPGRKVSVHPYIGDYPHGWGKRIVNGIYGDKPTENAVVFATPLDYPCK